MKKEKLLNYLQKRRSTSLRLMGDKRPSDEEINQILKIAARSPDHGKLCPWYFIVIKDEARHEISTLLREAYLADEDPNTAEAKLELESERFSRAPMAIIVVSRIREGKHPLWEQFLSAGAVCMNLSHACHALGYGVNWLSEWYSYSPTFRESLGLDKHDNIAGVLYIGDIVEQPEERERPHLEKITTFWTKEGDALNKGDKQNPHKGKGYPEHKIEGL